MKNIISFLHLFLIFFFFSNKPVTGQIWKKIDPDPKNPNLGSVFAIQAISPEMVWAVHANYFEGASKRFSGYVSLTYDGGSSWKISHLRGGKDISVQYFRADNEFEAYLITKELGKRNIIYYTKNQGESWAEIYMDSSFSRISYVYFWDDKNGIIEAPNIAGGVGLYTTNDGGLSWNLVNQSFFSIPEGLIYYFGSFEIDSTNLEYLFNNYKYYSNDFGKTWIKGEPVENEITTPNWFSANCFEADFTISSNGFGISYCSKFGFVPYQPYAESYFQITYDSGKHWNSYYDLSSLGYFFTNDICIVRESEYILLNIIFKDQISKTLLSKDKGSTWQIIEQGTKVNFLHFFNNQTGWGAWSGNNSIEQNGAPGDRKIYKYIGSPLDQISLTNDTVQDRIHVYPNPLSNEIFIQIDDHSDHIKLLIIHENGNGSFIMADKINEGLFVAEIGNLPSGRYFGKLALEDKSQFFSFIITK